MSAIVPSAGELVAGRFRVEAEIGRGGVGAVLRARDPSSNLVAIKVLLPEAVVNPEAIPRFINEARASRELVSQHAVRVFEFGTLDTGLPFMVMELLDGVDVDTMMEQRGQLPVTEVCDLVIDACDALAEAHARGMVHRDLKPANLFAAKLPDGSVCIKVLDFGLSKLTSQMRHAALTSTGAFLGSPHYMAPEQLKSAKGVDARADIWSLGVVIYELLTSKLPFDGRSFGQLFMQIVSQEPDPVTQHQPDIPPALAEIIARCLKKDREERYPDLGALTVALAAFASPARAAAARRIAERGAPRAPAVSAPQLEVAAPVANPPAPPAMKLGGTMLMANAPQFVRPAPSQAAPVARSPGSFTASPAGPVAAPPMASVVPHAPPAPMASSLPLPPATHPPVMPHAPMPSPSRSPRNVVLPLVAIFIVLFLAGVLVAVTRLRGP